MSMPVLLQGSAPPPDLRIIPVENIHPHEEHDPQRSAPLMTIIQRSEFMTNPPIVAPMDDENYVILDGSNRYYSFSSLGYEHLLVQVASYEGEYVELGVWQHVISGWDEKEFKQQIDQIEEIDARPGWHPNAVANILLHDGLVLSIHVPVEDIHHRNAVLRKLVNLYQKQATLFRTALTDPTEIWPLYPEAIALIMFPSYKPEDIIAAAGQKAYLPAGVSRHMIHGRALKINYPLMMMRADGISLEKKNDILQRWVLQKLTNRKVRYYAEATYVFDE